MKQHSEDENFVFVGEPEEVNVEKEAKKISNEVGFDAVKLADALLMLGEKMIGVPLYSYQRDPAFRIIYSMLVGDGAEITLLFSRQSGKSEVIAVVSVIVGVFFPVLAKVFKELSHFQHGVKMGAFAPQLEQVETLHGRAVERLYLPSTLEFLTDPDIDDMPLSKVNFKLKSGSFLKAQSGAKQSKIESKTYHLVFIDESQDMDTQKVRKSIIPMTAATFGTIVRLGTPNRHRGDFYYTIVNNKANDKKLNRKYSRTRRSHFEYDYKAVIKAKNEQFKVDGRKFHTLYEKSVERDIATMGINSEAFRMSYALEWLLDVGMFMTEARLEECVYDKRINFPRIEDDSFVVAGLDIASARASTVLTLGLIDNPAIDPDDRPKKTVAEWVEIQNTNYETQFELIADKLISSKVKVLFGDYTGVGRALMDRLIYHFSEYILIIPYTFSPGSKSDMWKRLDEDILAKRVRVPAHPTVINTQEFRNFEEQILNLQKAWRGSYLICEKVQGYKDDYCDSLALMNLAGNYLYNPPTEIEVTIGNSLIGQGNLGLINDSKW